VGSFFVHLFKIADFLKRWEIQLPEVLTFAFAQLKPFYVHFLLLATLFVPCVLARTQILLVCKV
jgi:hypothetical protein